MKKFISLAIAIIFMFSIVGCCSAEKQIIEDSKHLARLNAQNWEVVIDATDDPETLSVLKEFADNAKRLEKTLDPSMSDENE
jgi:hypothetical protein